MSTEPAPQHSFRRFLAWPLREKRAFAYALIALPVAELWVRTLGSKSARKLFDRKVSAPPQGAGIDPRRANQIVKLAAAYTIGNENKCLRRSLVLARILRANGLPVEVHIGFRKDDRGALVGHAWCDMADDSGQLQSPEGIGYVRFE
ncbi:MAG: lasso peptide biosynthesis B2 protein [Porphyrobacter sp.]|nr:lasso peptide biosynthesis B2 protein [Porphyrobacter sp.]